MTKKHPVWIYFFSLILAMLLDLPSKVVLAANLSIEPSAPTIAVGQSIQLTVSGASGNITWLADRGQVLGSNSTRITYVPPNEVGQYRVMVSADNGAAKVDVMVLPEDEVAQVSSRENANWKVFTNRSNIYAIALSADEKTLWVGTMGGLEQRDAESGQLQKVLTNLDGLPDNFVGALANAQNGGLWVGTAFGGLGYMNNLGEWTVFDTENSGLPDNIINALVSDGNGGVWIATGQPLNENELSNLVDNISQENGNSSITPNVDSINTNNQGDFFQLFTQLLVPLLMSGLGDNSTNSTPSPNLDGNFLDTLLGPLFEEAINEDENGDIFGSLLGNEGNELSDSDTSINEDIFGSLFGGDIFGSLLRKGRQRQKNSLDFDLLGDIGNSSLLDTWLGDSGMNLLSSLNCSEGNPFRTLFSGSAGGLAHLSRDGEWQVFNTDNSKLPDNILGEMISDGKGGLWIGTYCGGLVHYSSDGEWTIYNTDNSNLPGNFINGLAIDDKEGLWVATAFNGIAYYDRFGKWTVYDKNSGLPSNSVADPIPDSHGGVWMGTGNILEKTGGLVYLDNRGEITIYNTENSDLPNDVATVLTKDSQNRLWIGTQGSGIARLDSNNQWTTFPTNTVSGLADNMINHNAVVHDGDGGIWIGMGGYTGEGGLAHLKSNNQWQTFNIENSDLPNNRVYALAKDNRDNLWIGTLGGGLASLSSDNKWRVFNTSNSQLPDNDIAALANDGHEGLWIGTGNSGLVHSSILGQFTIYNTQNSNLPDNTIGVLLDDNNGGVWIGTLFGLAHLSNQDSWTIYNTDNSPLPHNMIASLINDGNGGIWIGTGVGETATAEHESVGGLAHLSSDGQWTVYTTANSDLPNNSIRALAKDGNNELWVGTLNGLLHINSDDEWKIFKTSNSGLPNNFVRALASDGKNGLWTVGSGLAHLTFSLKPAICSIVATQEQCQALLEQNRAAILIHPNGEGGEGDTQENTVNFMANYVYQSLQTRGFDHDEIHYVAYKPDVDLNGDGLADHIVDTPITLTQLRSGTRTPKLDLEHIENAFNWAKEKGQLDQPLIVVFVDHGLPDNLLLTPTGNKLHETQFKALLDDYQAATGNQVVVILEACYTGTLIDTLQDDNRVIISSTGENLSYYSALGHNSFTKFYFAQLRKGVDYWNALQLIQPLFAELRDPFNLQTPQLEDLAGGALAQNLCLNGCFGELPGPVLRIKNFNSTITPHQDVELKATGEVGITGVMVTITTPQTANQINPQGYLQPPLQLRLREEPPGSGQWQTSYNGFTTLGSYTINFEAQGGNDQGLPRCMVENTNEERCFITFTVGNSPTLHATFNGSVFTVPAVAVPNDIGGQDILQAKLNKRQDSETLFDLDLGALILFNGDLSTVDVVNYDPNTGGVHFPVLGMPDGSTRSANLKLLNDPQNPWLFELSY